MYLGVQLPARRNIPRPERKQPPKDKPKRQERIEHVTSLYPSANKLPLEFRRVPGQKLKPLQSEVDVYQRILAAGLKPEYEEWGLYEYGSIIFRPDFRLFDYQYTLILELKERHYKNTGPKMRSLLSIHPDFICMILVTVNKHLVTSSSANFARNFLHRLGFQADEWTISTFLMNDQRQVA